VGEKSAIFQEGGPSLQKNRDVLRRGTHRCTLNKKGDPLLRRKKKKEGKVCEKKKGNSKKKKGPIPSSKEGKRERGGDWKSQYPFEKKEKKSLSFIL